MVTKNANQLPELSMDQLHVGSQGLGWAGRMLAYLAEHLPRAALVLGRPKHSLCYSVLKTS